MKNKRADRLSIFVGWYIINTVSKITSKHVKLSGAWGIAK